MDAYTALVSIIRVGETSSGTLGFLGTSTAFLGEMKSVQHVQRRSSDCRDEHQKPSELFSFTRRLDRPVKREIPLSTLLI
jgi:hypothetical protein